MGQALKAERIAAFKSTDDCSWASFASAISGAETVLAGLKIAMIQHMKEGLHDGP